MKTTYPDNHTPILKDRILFYLFGVTKNTDVFKKWHSQHREKHLQINQKKQSPLLNLFIEKYKSKLSW